MALPNNYSAIPSILDEISKLINNIRIDENESNDTLHLTANENILSKLAHSFLSSPLSNRYHLKTTRFAASEQWAEKSGLMFKALENVYNLEKYGTVAANNLFNSLLCDLRPLSGMHGIISTLATATHPNALIYTIAPSEGGHFATANMIRNIGRRSDFIKLDHTTKKLDLDYFSKIVNKQRPDAVVFDHGATLFEFPLKTAREILGENTLIVYDASHVLGLIAGKTFHNPLTEGCDILQGNTHKTFPGPHKSLIACKNESLGNRIFGNIDASMVSSQHTHHTIALLITILEMLIHGESYAKQMVSNAKCLAKNLLDKGFSVVNGNVNPTDTNMFLVEFGSDEECYDACKTLHIAKISTNARNLFGRCLLRIGVQEVTRRGMKETEMAYIAELFFKLLKQKGTQNHTANEVTSFVRQYNKIHYSFDDYLESLPMAL